MSYFRAALVVCAVVAGSGAAAAQGNARHHQRHRARRQWRRHAGRHDYHAQNVAMATEVTVVTNAVGVYQATISDSGRL